MSPTGVAICLALSACLVFLKQDIWLFVRTAVTVVHEFGHAFMVLLLGGEVRSFTVRMDTSGEVVHALPKGRLRSILVASAGYPAPSITSAIIAFCIYQDWQKWGLYTMTVIAAVTVLLWVRGLWALLVLTGFAVLFFALAYRFSPLAQDFVLWMLVGILGFGGLKSSFEQFIRECHTRSSESVSDARTVAKLVHIPRKFVSFLFLITSTAASIFAGWVIFRTIGWDMSFL